MKNCTYNLLFKYQFLVWIINFFLFLSISNDLTQAQVDEPLRNLPKQEGLLIEINNDYRKDFVNFFPDVSIFKEKQTYFSIVVDSSFSYTLDTLLIPYQIKGNLFSVRVESAPIEGSRIINPGDSPSWGTGALISVPSNKTAVFAESRIFVVTT